MEIAEISKSKQRFGEHRASCEWKQKGARNATGLTDEMIKKKKEDKIPVT